MPESLLSTSSVLLFGRELTDLKIVAKAEAPNEYGNKVFYHQYSHGGNDPGKREEDLVRFARIYAYSYGGRFSVLEMPAIYLVHGPGEKAQEGVTGSKAAARPDSVDVVGSVGQWHSFAEDIYVWTYDKSDFSLRLDTSAGMLEEILLGVEFNDEMDPPSFGGTKLGGGRVGGGRVGGGRVGGGRVGGGRVGGGRVGSE